MTATTAVLLPALLAGVAAGVLVGLPRVPAVRLRGLRPPATATGAWSSRAADVAGRDGVGGRGGQAPAEAVTDRLVRDRLVAGPAVAGVVRAGPVRPGLVGAGPLGAGPLVAAGPLVGAGPLVAAVAGLVLAGPLVAALAGGLIAVGVRALRRRATRSARDRERARAIEACTVLAAELRAGRTPPSALAAAAETGCGATGSALAAAASTAALGGDVPAALAAAPQAGQPPAAPELLRGLAACWVLCSTTGAGLAAAVERLEQGQRAAQDQRRAVQAELAGPRATATMLALLPLVGLLLAGALGADPLHVLLHTPVGNACLVAGVGLDLAGLAWTGRLVTRAGGAG